MALVIFYFGLSFVFSFGLAQRVGRRTPYDRRDIVLYLTSALATTVALALLAAWGVHGHYLTAHEAVGFLALPVGMSLGGLAGGLLADARRRRSGLHRSPTG